MGTVPYREAWDLQRRLVEARHAGAKFPDVAAAAGASRTRSRLGAGATSSEVLASPEHLRSLGATVIEVDRGGLATYHGPGQLVGYPILDLRPRGREVHSYLRNLEEALINTLLELGIPAQGVLDQKTGVWVADRKIASIGVRFSRWISSHGFALNLTSDLSYFNHIVPCGMPAVTMTSVSRESSVAQEFSALREMHSKPDESAATVIGIPDMTMLRSRVAHHLAQVFALDYVDECPPALDEILGAGHAQTVEATR